MQRELIFFYVDARIKTGIPIIGCPDYLRLMEGRAARVGRTGESVPAALRRAVERLDPPFAAASVYEGKRLLVLSGEADKLVPWEASRGFVEKVELKAGGVKKVSVYAGVGHECTDDMVQEMAGFIAEHCL